MHYFIINTLYNGLSLQSFDCKEQVEKPKVVLHGLALVSLGTIKAILSSSMEIEKTRIEILRVGTKKITAQVLNKEYRICRLFYRLLGVKTYFDEIREINNEIELLLRSSQGINALPQDMIQLINKNLSINSLGHMGRVCKKFNASLDDSIKIKALNYGYSGELNVIKSDLIELFRHVEFHFNRSNPCIQIIRNQKTNKIDIETTLNRMGSISLNNVYECDHFLSNAQFAKYLIHRAKKGESIELKEVTNGWSKSKLLAVAVEKRKVNLVELLLLHTTEVKTLNLNNMSHSGISKENTLDIIQLVIDYNLGGTVLDFQDEKGQSALMIAVDHYYVEIVKALIKSKADVNLQDRSGKTALHLAIEDIFWFKDECNNEIVKALLAGGANYDLKNLKGETPLMIAAYKGQLENVKALLAAGADFDLQDEHKLTALGYAIMNASQDCEVVRVIIEAGANIESDRSYSMLLDAVGRGAGIVNVLLEAGALGLEHDNGFSVLWKAIVQINDIEVLTALLAAGAHPERLSEGNRSLLMGHMYNKNVIQAFLNAKPFTPQSNSALSMLQWGAKYKNIIIINELLETGISHNFLDLVDNNGMSALMYAEKNNDQKIIEVLKSYKKQSEVI